MKASLVGLFCFLRLIGDKDVDSFRKLFPHWQIRKFYSSLFLINIVLCDNTGNRRIDKFCCLQNRLLICIFNSRIFLVDIVVRKIACGGFEMRKISWGIVWSIEKCWEEGIDIVIEKGYSLQVLLCDFRTTLPMLASLH